MSKVFPQGQPFTLTVPATIFKPGSIPTWGEPGQVSLTPAADGMSCVCVPKIDGTVESFNVTVSGINTIGQPITGAFTGADVAPVATSIPVTLSAGGVDPGPNSGGGDNSGGTTPTTPPSTSPGPTPAPVQGTLSIPSGMPGLSVINQADKSVINNGVIWDRSIAPTNFGAYVATVNDSTGAPIGTINIPRHDQFARYVLDPLPDTIVRDNVAIVAQKLMFPYGDPGAVAPDAPTNKFTGPMSTAGITTTMGQTGERPDIGLLPEPEAYAMRTGDFGPCIEHAKGFDSMPIYDIDEKTSRFMNMIDYPLACRYWNQNSRPDFIRTAPGLASDMSLYPPGTLKGQWDMDIGHSPAIYVAYLATEKLRYLESLQAFFNFGLQTTNWYTMTMGTPLPWLNISQTRSLGWLIRLGFMAWRATLDAEALYGPNLPIPLLPSSYFKTIMDANAQYLTDGYVKDPALQTFRYWPDKTAFRPWQFDYLLLALGFGSLLFPNSAWPAIYLWSLKNPIDRLDKTSGYPVAWQEPYFLRLGIAPKDKNAPTAFEMPDSTDNFPGDLKATAFFKDWASVVANAQAEAKAGFAAGAPNYWNMTPAEMAALAADPTGGGLVINWDSYTQLQLRNVMAQADYLDRNGIVAISKTYSQFPSARDLSNTMVANWVKLDPANHRIPSRVSIMPA